MPTLDLPSIRRGVLAVHGIGCGTAAERAGFSDRLRHLVFSGTDKTAAAPFWSECVWEELNDAFDARVAEIVGEMAKGPALDGFLDGSRRMKALLRMFEGSARTRSIVRTLDGLTRDAAAWFVSRTLDFGLDYWLYLDSAHGAKIRRKFRSCLAAAAKSHPGGLVVVAHSLGSVVAFDTLAEARRKGIELPVAHLVTFGSPLGWTVSLRDALGKPENKNGAIGAVPWTNLYYREDCVPLYKPLPADRFPEADNVALPLPKRTKPRTAHSAYWRDPAVARLVREALRANHE